MTCPHQSRYLQALHKGKPSVWQNLPTLLTKAGIHTPTGQPYKIQSVNHWKAARKSRPVPEECIAVIARAYADDDLEGSALEIEAALGREMKRDSHRGDFGVNADEQLRGIKLLKIIMPPFTSPRTSEKRNHERTLIEKPFLDFWADRITGFSGHRVSIEEHTDVAKVLEDIVAQKQTTKIGFGLLSSMERLTLLEPLHLPIRVGLNAVCLIRDESDRQRIKHIRELLLGYPLRNAKFETVAIAARHDVGWAHLKQLQEEGILSRPPVAVSTTTASEFIQRLTHRGTTNVLRYAVANEITCLAILKELRSQNSAADGELVFKLATEHSIESLKPEYLMSILVKRGDSQTLSFVKDVLWMALQADVELYAQQYSKLCNSLKAFAEEAGEHEEAKEWAEYTLRLHKKYLNRYVDHYLPWRPILERAYSILNPPPEPK